MKMRFLKYALPVLGFALVTGTSAHALAFFKNVPEVDPSLAVGALMLLVGSLAVMRARRRK
jgi:hypothetical protein